MLRSTLSLLIACSILLIANQALALDGYQKRKGIFYGLGFGGGHIQSDAEDSKGRIGYNFRARIGGGVNEQLTLDAEFGLANASYAQSGGDVEDSTTTVGVAASYFLAEGFNIRVQLGIADLKSEFTNGNDTSSNDETGIFVAAGVGYEFFANADLAIGVGVDFQHQMYDDNNVNALNFGVTANWY